ncbi:uncharacterized protein V6R79_018496 [Siganus canaliculatus]
MTAAEDIASSTIPTISIKGFGGTEVGMTDETQQLEERQQQEEPQLQEERQEERQEEQQLQEERDEEVASETPDEGRTCLWIPSSEYYQ